VPVGRPTCWLTMRSVKLRVPPEVSDQKLLAFARCYQFETWLREMVYLELKAHFGRRYWEECDAAFRRQGTGGIPPDRSLDRDRQHSHMTTAENDPLWFISFDALTKLLLDDHLWPLFEPYLTTRKLFDAKIEEVRIVRNRVAHARSLHKDDLDRLMRVLRDVDKGFWHFCSSYGDRYDWRNRNRHAGDSVAAALTSESESHGVEIYVRYAYRPAVKSDMAAETGRGVLYVVTFSLMHRREFMHYEDLLKATQAHHQLTAHIILDFHQQLLHVTFPAVEENQEIIRAARRFGEAAANCTTIAPLFQKLDRQSRSLRRKVIDYNEALSSALDEIAAQWPHYVISPSHPYANLDSDCPCDFFGTE
jgi:hypothetical protein